MKNQIWFRAAALTLGVVLAQHAAGQAPTISFNVAGPATWNLNSNWTSPDGAFVPGDNFPLEIAQISNGGTAFLDAPAFFPIQSLVLGLNGGQTGTLQLRPGGSLTAVDPEPASPSRDGAVVVGEGGNGQLLLTGGTLNAASLNVGGEAASTLRAEGSSTINLTGNANLNRVTRIIGPNVDFNVGGNVQVSQNFQPVITGATHSAITATGNATVSGNLAVEFSGVSPAFGNTWTLIDAADATGKFTNITSTGATLPRGTALDANVDVGNNGNVTLAVENRLILKVDRGTGATTLENAVGAPIAFDAYTIQSPGGWLLSSNARWSSLDDQNVGTFAEANPTANAISELSPTGSTSLAVGATRSLGTPFQFVPTEFGQSGDDLIFQYSRPTGEIESGIIEYVGDVNNLVLQIDPATGQGRIEHQSPLSATIDAYVITSASGSLTPATWTSLDDQNIGGWAEANPQPTGLSELLPVGGVNLVDGMTFNLGHIFNTAGTRDVRFDFGLTDGTVLNGVVQYVSLSNGPIGDTNDDGKVDLNDLNNVRNNFGGAGVGDTDGDNDVDLDDLNNVRNNFGAGGSQSVPEPQAMVLLALGATAFGAWRVRRK